MTRGEYGRGTVKPIKKDGVVIAYQAFLPREFSTPPEGCKNPKHYQELLGPRFKTEAEARRLLDAAILELRDKRTLRHGLPFAHFVDAELKARYHAAKLKYETVSRAYKHTATWRSIDKCWLQDAPFYDWPPSNVSIPDLQAWFDYLRDEAEGHKGDPLSSHFIRNVAAFCRAVFNRAKIKPNPADSLELPKKSEPRVPYLELTAQRRLFGCEDIPLADRVMIGCGMGSGLRIGELLAMEVTEVALDDHDPHLMVKYGGPDRSPTKGRRERRVELFEPGLGFWRRWMADHRNKDSELVFAGPRGGFQKHWPEQFGSWAEKAGVRRMSSHIMRHSYAVAMLSGTWGYEPKGLDFVSVQLGHADRVTTERFYKQFEGGTWRKEVRHMTGRAGGPRTIWTADALLGT
jgi:integrase